MRVRTYLSRTSLFLAIVVTVFGIGKFHAAYIGHYDLTASSRFWWILVYASLCWVLAYSFGLPEVGSARTRLKSALAASVMACTSFIIIQAAIATIVLPRFLLALSIPCIALALFFASTISARFNRLAADRERVLLVCHNDDAEIVRQDIEYHTEIPCVIASFLDDKDPFTAGKIESIVRNQKITLVVLSESASKSAEIVDATLAVHSTGVRVRNVLSFYNDWIGKIPLRELKETALLFDVREIHHVGYARASRLIDIAVATAGLFVLALVAPIVLLGNYLGNKGPLLYAQDRVGRDQKLFRIVKFRSMRPGSSNGEWTQENDTRITAFGSFLRKSHLDELPQVLNILGGDLSIVGPRPEQPHYVSKLANAIPYYNSRHIVRPGLTGWAQVNYPYGADEIDAFEKLQYEFWYLQHQSLSVDLRIMARTFRHILGFKGR